MLEKELFSTIKEFLEDISFVHVKTEYDYLILLDLIFNYSKKLSMSSYTKYATFMLVKSCQDTFKDYSIQRICFLLEQELRLNLIATEVEELSFEASKQDLNNLTGNIFSRRALLANNFNGVQVKY